MVSTIPRMVGTIPRMVLIVPIILLVLLCPCLCDTTEDRVGTTGEIQDRLSVVIRDPIVELARGLFRSLVEIQEQNHRKEEAVEPIQTYQFKV